MRLRTLSAVMLMAASSAASAAPAPIVLPGLGSVLAGMPTVGMPAIPGVGALTGNPAYTALLQLGVGGANGLLTPLLSPLFGAAGSLPALPGLSGGLPGLTVPTIPGLLPLPALPIPVTQIVDGMGGFDMTFATLEGLAPAVTSLPNVPGVTTIFANYGH